RSQPSAVHQLARLCDSTENDTVVLESIESSLVVQRRGNTRHALPLRPGNIRLFDLTLAARTNSRYTSRVVRVYLSGTFRVSLFSRRLQNNVRRSQKHQTATDDRRTFPARRQPSCPPALRSIREIVGH